MSQLNKQNELKKINEINSNHFISPEEIVAEELEPTSDSSSLNSRMKLLVDNTDYNSEEAKEKRIEKIDLMLNILKISGAKRGKFNFKKRVSVINKEEEKKKEEAKKKAAVEAQKKAEEEKKKAPEEKKLSEIDALLESLKTENIQSGKSDEQSLKKAKMLAQNAPTYRRHWWDVFKRKKH